MCYHNFNASKLQNNATSMPDALFHPQQSLTFTGSSPPWPELLKALTAPCSVATPIEFLAAPDMPARVAISVSVAVAVCDPHCLPGLGNPCILQRASNTDTQWESSLAWYLPEPYLNCWPENKRLCISLPVPGAIKFYIGGKTLITQGWQPLRLKAWTYVSICSLTLMVWHDQHHLAG